MVARALKRLIVFSVICYLAVLAVWKPSSKLVVLNKSKLPSETFLGEITHAPRDEFVAHDPEVLTEDVMGQFSRAVDSKVIPQLVKMAQNIPGTTVPQIILVDAVPALSVLLMNMIESLKRVKLDEALVVMTCGGACEKSSLCKHVEGMTSRCIDFQWLYTAVRPYTKLSRTKWNDFEASSMARMLVAWRLLAKGGVGVTLLDAHSGLLRNMWEVPWKIGEFDVVHGLRYGACGQDGHFLSEKIKSAKGNCAIPITPLMLQPGSVHFVAQVIREYFGGSGIYFLQSLGKALAEIKVFFPVRALSCLFIIYNYYYY
jgi:hypothetical protein